MKRKTWFIIGAALLVVALVLVFALRGGPEGTYDNLILNGDFEQLDEEGLFAHWYTDSYFMPAMITEYAVAEGVSGNGGHIRNLSLNDARFAQIVSVSPNTTYRLHGYIKADAVQGHGANLSIEGPYVFSEAVYDTEGEWVEVTLYGVTGPNQKSLTVFARLGGYSGEAQGEAWFDDITLCRVDSVPDGYITELFYTQKVAEPSVTDTTTKTGAFNLTLASACYVVIFLLAVWYISTRQEKPLNAERKYINGVWLAVLLAIAAVVRFALADSVYGYDVDINCFISWGNRMREIGPAGFYEGVFCDYPPGYMLVLWLISGFYPDGLTALAVKLPSIVSDLGMVVLLYHIGKKYASGAVGLALAALYALNPLMMVSGAAWGQADGVMTLAIVLVVMYALEGKWRVALPVYMLAVLLKPQALMFGPLGLLALVIVCITAMLGKDQEKKAALLKDVGIGLGLTLLVALVIVTPFSVQQGGIGWLIEKYGKTMSYYDYATVNSCNLYFLVGANWTKISELAKPLTVALGCLILLAPAAWHLVKTKKYIILGAAGGAAAVLVTLSAFGLISYNIMGMVMMALVIGVVVVQYLIGQDIKHLPLLGGVLLTAFFTLGSMMHERYLFPAIALLLVAYAIEKDKRILLLAVGITITCLFNVGAVLDRNIRIGGADAHLSMPALWHGSDMAWMEYASAVGNCLLSMFALHLGFALCRKDAVVLPIKGAKAAEKTQEQTETTADIMLSRALTRSQPIHRMKWIDYVLMLGITAIYAVVAFSNLGSNVQMDTYWLSRSDDQQVIFDLGEQRDFYMLYYGGIHWSDHHFAVETSVDGENWTSLPNDAEMGPGSLYQWKYVTYFNFSPIPKYNRYTSTPIPLSGRYVRLSCNGAALKLFEVMFRNPDTLEIYPVVAISDTMGDPDIYKLIDEQDKMDGSQPSWYNSMYFDEIYHARTGYEHLNGLATYETSHPPLGKILIGWAIGVFGMTPFGWRFAGTLAGVLMLPGMYMLGRLLFKRREFAFGAMFLMAVDFMHFAQTRIATIDSFVVLFIIWSVYFMLRWLKMDFFAEKPWKSFLWLGLSGLFMGLAVASKWTGCYAGVGLALLFFWGVWRRGSAIVAARGIPAKKRDEYTKAIAETGSRLLMWNVLSCLVFFVAVPVLIYYLSYIPYFKYNGGVTVQRVIGAAEGMLDYHSKPGLGMDHPFYSPWYEWPMMIKPMWFYSDSYKAAGVSSTILTFGNPAVWWTGLVALICIFGVWLKRHLQPNLNITLYSQKNDIRPAVLLICFLAQYVPWTLVPRGTYIYHYFPSVPFIILCIMLCLEYLGQCGGERFGKVMRITSLVLFYGLMAAALVLFIAFFPYISGITVSTNWLHMMQWFQGWIYY